MNGQDFNTNNSDAYITFVGTGSGGGQLKILIFILLLTLLIFAIAYLCLQKTALQPRQSQGPYTASDDPLAIRESFGTMKYINPENSRLSPSHSRRSPNQYR
jgi:hypothetical protein